jgi:molecular chaperone DnaK
VKKASEGTEIAAVEQALAALTEAQHRAAESLYKQAQPSGATPGAETGAAGGGATGGADEAKGGDVIDAEVVDEGKGN